MTGETIATTARSFLEAATTESEAALDTVRAALGDGVTLSSPMGDRAGTDAVLESLGATRGMLATGTWAEPTVDGDEVELSATFPPGSVLGTARLTLRFDGDGSIVEVRQRLTPGGPPPPSPVDLGGIAAEINGALDNGRTVVVAYVDAAGQPNLSFRGTVQVFDPTHVALWVRDPNGGLPNVLAANPRLTFWYHDGTTWTTYQIQGRGHVDADPQVRDAVFEHSPPREQQIDRDRAGVAIVVDVDLVTGRGPVGSLNMRSDAAPS